MQPNQSDKSQETSKEDTLKILLHQYETIVDLYKHHLDLLLKVNIFIYAITGAILSYYLSQPHAGLIRYALIFPAIVNITYSGFFFLASTRITAFDNDIKAIVKALGVFSYPDMMFLKLALLISSGLYFLISIGLFLITCLQH